MKKFSLERVLWELLLLAIFIMCAWFLVGCDVNTDPTAPLPLPKNYVPKNPPIEKPAPRPAPAPSEPAPLGPGDKVRIETGTWATTQIAHGVILSGLLPGNVMKVLFVSHDGTPTVVETPASILIRE